MFIFDIWGNENQDKKSYNHFIIICREDIDSNDGMNSNDFSIKELKWHNMKLIEEQS